MKERNWKVITASISVLVVLLLIASLYLFSIVTMGQTATLASNKHLTVGPLTSSTESVKVRYSGYLTISYSSSSEIAITVKYSFAGHNFSSTYLGINGRINMPVLPSTVAIVFTATLSTADIHYSVSEQY